MFKKNKKQKKQGLIGKLIGYNEIKDNINFTKKIITEENENTYVKETFEDSLRRFGIKDSDKKEYLKNKYNQMRDMSLINYFFSVIVFTFFGVNLYRLDEFTIMSIFSIIITFSLSLFFIIKGIMFALRCYQIKNQELGLLKEFLKNKKNIIPNKEL
jgi:hypothetical protein